MCKAAFSVVSLAFLSAFATLYRVGVSSIEVALREASVNGSPIMLDARGGSFRDDMVYILPVVASIGAVYLEIENLSPATVRIIWNEASFVDGEGYSSRVVPGETRVIDAARSQPVTPIPPNARTRIWAISPSASPDSMTVSNESEAVAFCRTFAGATLRLVLPIEGQTGKREYGIALGVGEVQVGGRSAAGRYEMAVAC